MAASVTFFPVSNGDMTLIELENRQCILTDINIRLAADDDEDEQTPDVAGMLRERLKERGRDCKGRLYVDTFCLSHPDQDHIAGLERHFHLGPPEDWSEDEDKILIKEMWSSPVVFRRASENNSLCDDAKAWNKEAKRRMELYRDKGDSITCGDRILILGEDENIKTDDILEIVIKIGDKICKSNCQDDHVFSARLLGPLPPSTDEDGTEVVKNRSSVILRYSFHVKGKKDRCLFLSGGDTEVEIWKRLWGKCHVREFGWLEYDILQAPHHCSWGSLSFDGWSEEGENAKVDKDARSALSCCRGGAVIVSSSKKIKDDDDNPPHYRARKEYIDIVDGDDERFYCTEDEWDTSGQALKFTIDVHGPKKSSAKSDAAAAKLFGVGAIAATPRPHG